LKNPIVTEYIMLGLALMEIKVVSGSQ